ncbi:MAG: helix-turn-helix domain-containing protein [Bacteroidales bacterium]|nr:MAG: helix-turn-helix domain-containing protein [Bacteroidales bacterium]
MKELEFHKTKYGKELLIDCLKISETEDFLVNRRPSVMLFYEIYFIIKGNGTFFIEDTTIPYRKGTIIFIPPYRRREWNAERETDAYCILFEDEFINQFFNDSLFVYRFQYFYSNNTSFHISTTPNEFKSYIEKVVEIKTEISNLLNDSEHLLRSIFYYLLITLNRKYIDQHHIKGDLFQNIEVLKFIQLIDKNFKEKHLVEDYTQMLGISKTYLNKKLKSLGTTASDLIKARLLREAKKELHYSNLSISEIAYDLNFSEPANFIRFFKKMTSLTPSQFRLEFSK